jgi:two-component sensor histidine kinase
VVAGAGFLLLLIAVGQGVVIVYGGGSALEAWINTLLIGLPATMLLYTGFWMPDSKIDPEYYPRLLAWVLGGVAVMFGFILLRDLHPGVTVEWSLGTQAIALTIGSTGGLLIAVQETKAKMQTKQLECQTRRLEARERALERHNEQLEQFASIVSHDLRNPLNVAQGRLELAREECDSEHLPPVADAHDRMTALIEDLLTLAREGETVRELQLVSLEEVAADCWRTVATADATLEIDMDRRIRADPDRIHQLLGNLFRNSVEHGSTDVDADGLTITIGEHSEGSTSPTTVRGSPKTNASTCSKLATRPPTRVPVSDSRSSDRSGTPTGGRFESPKPTVAARVSSSWASSSRTEADHRNRPRHGVLYAAAPTGGPHESRPPRDRFRHVRRQRPRLRRRSPDRVGRRLPPHRHRTDVRQRTRGGCGDPPLRGRS